MSKYIVVKNPQTPFSQVVNDCETGFCFPVNKGDNLSTVIKKLCSYITKSNDTSFVETDPIFLASPAYNIDDTNISNWDIAYSWGDHNGLYSLLNHTHPVSDLENSGANIGDVLQWDGSQWIPANVGGAPESDPIFLASDAAGISSIDISNWNNTFSWGDHNLVGYLTSESDPVFDTWLLSSPNISTFTNDSGYITENLYIIDGTLSSDRIVNCDNKDLSFNDFSKFSLSKDTGRFEISNSQVEITADSVNLNLRFLIGAELLLNGTAGIAGQVITAQGTGSAPIWANPPASVTPAALTKTDDTNVTLTLGGTPNTALLQNVSLTLGWTGTLADGRIASASTWNAKQAALSGTGIVKSTAGTISYLTDNSTNWDTAFGWGNHASAGYIGGSGTTNYISKWSGASSLTNSQIFDNGTNVGIGTASPAYKLDVNGDVQFGQNTNHITRFFGGGSIFQYNPLGLGEYRLYSVGTLFLQGTGTNKVAIGTFGGNVAIGTTELMMHLGDVSNTSGTKNGFGLTFRSLHSSGSGIVNIFNINPVFDQTSANTSTIRGFYYNPSFSQSLKGSNIAWENTSGDVILGNLAGSGNRMVIADSNGKLSVQTIPTSSGTVTSVSASTGMNFTTITGSGSIEIDTSKVPYYSGGFSTGLAKWNGSSWVFDNSTYLTSITGLNISLLTNDSAFITTSALSSYLTSATAASTYEPIFTVLPISKGGTNSNTALSNNRIIQSSGGAVVEATAITAARALKSDANGIPTHFDTATEPSLIELAYVKGVTSDIQTQIDTKQDKSMAAYTFFANNTNATANASGQVFKSIAEQAYTGSITWTGTTAPSGTTKHSYIWQQVGNVVTLFIRLDYATSSTATTSVLFDLPTDCPAPLQVSGLSGANTIHYRGNGTLVTNNSTNGVNLVASLKRNAANTGWDISMSTSSGVHRVANATIQYIIN